MRTTPFKITVVAVVLLAAGLAIAAAVGVVPFGGATDTTAAAKDDKSAAQPPLPETPKAEPSKVEPTPTVAPTEAAALAAITSWIMCATYASASTSSR
jgi:hypothetical protein